MRSAEKKMPSLEGGRAQYESIIEIPNHYSIEAAAEQVAFDLYGAGRFTGKGQWQRFKPDGANGDSGYIGLLNDLMAVVGDWRTGQHLVVLVDDNDSEEERQEKRREARQQAEQARKAREAEQARGYALVAKRTRAEWLALSPADPHHPYLAKKAVQPHQLRQKGNLLVIPLTDGQRLVNWQTIAADGAKRFQPGGQVKGCYHPIGEIHTDHPLLIAEGWATAATLHEATGYPVAGAMNCGNMRPVATNLRERYPGAAIIVCADNDHRTPGNPGITAGKAAAAAVGGRCVWPPAIDGVTDFNDLATAGQQVAL